MMPARKPLAAIRASVESEYRIQRAKGHRSAHRPLSAHERAAQGRQLGTAYEYSEHLRSFVVFRSLRLLPTRVRPVSDECRWRGERLPVGGLVDRVAILRLNPFSGITVQHGRMVIAHRLAGLVVHAIPKRPNDFIMRCRLYRLPARRGGGKC